MGAAVGALLLVVALAVGEAHAAEVYRWTDEAGRVHYGERPPPDGAQRIELPDGAGPAADDAGMAQRRARQQRLLEAFEQEREQERQREQAARQERQRIDDYCRGLQRRLGFLDHAGPIFYRRDDGTRDYLDDARRAAQRREVEAAYRRRCGSR